MKALREYVCRKLDEDVKVYPKLKEFLEKEELKINFVLFEDDYDEDVLKLLDRFLQGVE